MLSAPTRTNRCSRTATSDRVCGGGSGEAAPGVRSIETKTFA